MKASGFRVEIKKYRATGVWKWEVPDSKQKDRKAALDESEECGICRMAFDSTCPDCLLPGDDCPPVRGNCSHMYHMHCIVKWINSQTDQDESGQQCPMCRAPWKFQSE